MNKIFISDLREKLDVVIEEVHSVLLLIKYGSNITANLVFDADLCWKKMWEHSCRVYGSWNAWKDAPPVIHKLLLFIREIKFSELDEFVQKGYKTNRTFIDTCFFMAQGNENFFKYFADILCKHKSKTYIPDSVKGELERIKKFCSNFIAFGWDVTYEQRKKNPELSDKQIKEKIKIDLNSTERGLKLLNDLEKQGLVEKFIKDKSDLVANPCDSKYFADHDFHVEIDRIRLNAYSILLTNDLRLAEDILCLNFSYKDALKNIKEIQIKRFDEDLSAPVKYAGNKYGSAHFKQTHRFQYSSPLPAQPGEPLIKPVPVQQNINFSEMPAPSDFMNKISSDSLISKSSAFNGTPVIKIPVIPFKKLKLEAPINYKSENGSYYLSEGSFYKIFKTPDKSLTDKINKMTTLNMGQPDIRWPVSLVYDEQNQLLIGYKIQSLEGEDLNQTLLNGKYILETSGLNDNVFLLVICKKLLQKLDYLRKLNINTENILPCDILYRKKNSDIYIINCDEFIVDEIPGRPVNSSIPALLFKIIMRGADHTKYMFKGRKIFARSLTPNDPTAVYWNKISEPVKDAFCNIFSEENQAAGMQHKTNISGWLCAVNESINLLKHKNNSLGLIYERK